MVQSRQGDLREQSLLRQGKGWFHAAGMGHEALAAGTVHLRPEDYCFLMYRDRAFALGRGMQTVELAREFFAKGSSPSGGRQLPAHYSSRRLNIWSHPSPTGAHLLPACGVAWQLKLAGQGGVAVAHCGDAASRQGDFYEAVCVAREHRLPLVLLVADNGYGISTPTRDINALALGVFDPGSWVRLNGRDVWEVYEGYGQAIAQARSEGPVFVWCELDRLAAHTSNDDHRQYRSPAELEEIARRDPLDTFRQSLIDLRIATEEELLELDEQVQREVREQYQQAWREADPQPGDFQQHVFGPLPQPPQPPMELPPEATMAGAIHTAFEQALATDPRVLFFGEDIEDPKGGVFKLTQELSTQFPGRVVNSPLAESTIVGLACGLASAGMRPVFEIQFADFMAPAWNQIVANLSTLRWRSQGEWKSPCVLYAPYGGYLPGGAIWHSQANESALAHYPGIYIAIPSTPWDAAGLFWTALESEDPVLLLLPKHLLRKKFTPTGPLAPVPLGKASVVRGGSDVTIVAWGNTVEIALEAAERVEAEVSVEVLDLRTIVPWDRESVMRSVVKTGRLVVVQEDTENCSVGQMVITTTLQDANVWSKLLAAPQLVTKGNVFIGLHPNHEYSALPSTENVVEAVLKVAGEQPQTAAVERPMPLTAAASNVKSPLPGIVGQEATATHATVQLKQALAAGIRPEISTRGVPSPSSCSATSQTSADLASTTATTPPTTELSIYANSFVGPSLVTSTTTNDTDGVKWTVSHGPQTPGADLTAIPVTTRSLPTPARKLATPPSSPVTSSANPSSSTPPKNKPLIPNRSNSPLGSTPGPNRGDRGTKAAEASAAQQPAVSPSAPPVPRSPVPATYAPTSPESALNRANPSVDSELLGGSQPQPTPATERTTTLLRIDSPHPSPQAHVTNSVKAQSEQVPILVPHLGEGIYAGQIVEFLKRPGEPVQQDEAICEIESEKATMTIEASHDGILASWSVRVGDTVAVGQAVAWMQTENGLEQPLPAAVGPIAETATQPTAPSATPTLVKERSANAIALTRAIQVPTAAVTITIPWDTIQAACERMVIDDQPCSPTAMIAWCLTQACLTEAGARFISHFQRAATEDWAFDLGIAVALPEDELTTAVLRDAGRLEWKAFHARYREAIASARRGERHDRRNVPIQLSTLGGHQIISAHPLVVPPSIATFFIGQAHYELIERDNKPVPAKVATATMSFDHRLVNGVGAASFVNALRDQIDTVVPEELEPGAILRIRDAA